MGKVQGRFDGVPLAAECSVDLVQVGAIPLVACSDGVTRVVLVTTRGSGRWSIPKGNPVQGLPPHKAAAREALEEAGLVGKTSKKPLGTYQFWKRRDDHWTLAAVDVHVMHVEDRKVAFKEAGERSTGLFTVDEAAGLVVEPGLKALIAAAGAVPRKSKGKGSGKRKTAARRRKPGEGKAKAVRVG